MEGRGGGRNRERLTEREGGREGAGRRVSTRLTPRSFNKPEVGSLDGKLPCDREGRSGLVDSDSTCPEQKKQQQRQQQREHGLWLIIGEPGRTMEKLKGPTAGCTTATCGWRALLLPQLNRQSLYVYGSEMAVEKECMRQLESGVFVIHPFSLIRYSICFDRFRPVLY